MTHVMTTGATLLVMMDLALLLWSPRVWKEWMLRECWSSMLPSPVALLSRGDAETACCAALAVVPIIRRRLCRDREENKERGRGRRNFFFPSTPVLGKENPEQAQGTPPPTAGKERPTGEETLTHPFLSRSCKGLSSSLSSERLPPPRSIRTRSS